MLCIKPTSLDPYFNIAAEEYFLKKCDQDVFMLWRNSPSIIVGKHQNTLGEINHPYVRAKDIKVVRRLSGGGTVFHDLGNVNFTFIRAGEQSKLVDFKKFTQPIVDALQQMGACAYHSGRNDLLIDGFKISGNAEHVYKDKVLHHGTLLFSSDISNLNEAIKVELECYDDKSVKSFRSKVTNIAAYVAEQMSVETFLDRVFDYVCHGLGGAELYTPTQEDNEQIHELVQTKYGTWEWNYAYSPAYALKRKSCKGSVTTHWNMEVQKGCIKTIKISHPEVEHTQELETGLLGRKLIYDEIEHYLSQNLPEGAPWTKDELMNLIF